MRRVLIAASAVLLLASSARAAYSPATTNGWLITSGRVAGVGGSLFRTDVWLFNPDVSATVTATLVFHPAVSTGQPAAAPVSSAPITLAPRETRFLADVTLSTVPVGDGVVGALEWQSSAVLMGAARIYTFTPTGTFGFFLPALPQSESLTARASADDVVNVLQIYGTNSGDASFRTNLDVTNTSAQPVPVEVRVIDPVTAEIYGGTQSYVVAPGSLLRLGAVFAAVGAPLVDGLRITIAVPEGTAIGAGGILAAAYTLDNRTQDAFAFVGQRQAP
ncbi:MAG TPA: hypothetical protein VH854_11595 [Thermoanaerobaculia bacterium]|nr:hypothetical protein [Thermoanaerobaculia bacterium]